MRTLKEFTRTVMIMKRLCDETFGITKYCLDLEIKILDILSIYYYCWSNLNSILRIPLYIRYLVLKHQYHSQMQLKTLLYLVSIIKIMYIEQTYLCVLSHELRKLEWIWYIFQYSNFGITYIFKVPIVYYYLVISISNWWKITLLIKVFKLMIHTCSPRVLQNYSPS